MENEVYKIFLDAKQKRDVETLKKLLEDNPEDLKIKFTYGSFCAKYRDKEEGKRVLKSLLDTSAKFYALVELGKISMAEKNYNTAIGYFERVIEESDNLKDINISCFQLGKIYHARNEYRLAYRYYDMILKNVCSYKDKVFSTFEQGRIDAEIGKFEKARHKFKKTLYLIENDRTKKINKYFVLLELGMLEKYDDNYEEAKMYFEEIIKESKNSKDIRLAQLELGKLYAKEGIYVEASKIYNDLYEDVVNSKDMTLNDRTRTIIDINLEKAKMSIDLKEYNKAIVILEEIIKNSPNQETTNFCKVYLARTYICLGNLDYAYTLLDGLEKHMRPKDKSSVYFELGNLSYAKGDVESAKEYFKLAISSNKAILSNNILTIIDIKEENYIDAFYKIKYNLDNNIKTDPKLITYISDKLNVGFNNFNDLDYTYIINQILEYNEENAIEQINTVQNLNLLETKFDDNVDIYKLFIDAKNNLNEEYLAQQLHFLDEYYIPANILGLEEENLVVIKTLPNTKNIIYIQLLSIKEKDFVKYKKK